MNQLPHDALARTTIHAPPLWQALQRHRQRRRRARRAALLVAALALIIVAPGPGWWDLERGANAVAALADLSRQQVPSHLGAHTSQQHNSCTPEAHRLISVYIPIRCRF